MQKAGNNIEYILEKFPFLTYNSEERYFIGYIQIDEDDKYHLKIKINNFPKTFPKVYELEDRIPKKAERHVNADYSLCFTTKANEEILLKTKIKDLQSFFQLILVPYLLNNSYFEINNQYKFGEYSHHPLISTYETYRDILNVENFELIETILIEIANGKKYRPNKICYCGSGKKIKKCKNHEFGYRNLKKINVDRLLNDSKKIKELKEELIKMNSKSA